MADLGRSIFRERLRRTTLCRESATIIDEETLADMQNLLNELGEEIYNTVTIRNFVSGTAHAVYGEDPNTKVWEDFQVQALVEENPSEQELMDLGIREEVELILKIFVNELKRAGLWGTDDQTTVGINDRVIFDGVEYDVVKVLHGKHYKDKPIIVNVVCRIYSSQGPRTVA